MSLSQVLSRVRLRTSNSHSRWSRNSKKFWVKLAYITKKVRGRGEGEERKAGKKEGGKKRGKKGRKEGEEERRNLELEYSFILEILLITVLCIYFLVENIQRKMIISIILSYKFTHIFLNLYIINITFKNKNNSLISLNLDIMIPLWNSHMIFFPILISLFTDFWENFSFFYPWNIWTSLISSMW